MHLNTDPPAELARPKKPCIRDLHELVTTHLKPELVKLVPLPELERRCKEIDVEHPHLKEETPLVIAFETRRRATHQSLQIVGSHTRVIPTASQAYSHA